MQKVYGVMVDGGDGSGHMRWYRSKALVDLLLDPETCNCEAYWMNEGDATELTFPDGLVLEECGFRFSDDDHDDIVNYKVE